MATAWPVNADNTGYKRLAPEADDPGLKLTQRQSQQGPLWSRVSSSSACRKPVSLGKTLTSSEWRWRQSSKFEHLDVR